MSTEVYCDYIDSQVDSKPEPNALTAREEALIASLKSKCLAKTASHVLTQHVSKSTQLFEIRERRGKYLQFVKNFTTLREAQSFFDSLSK